MGIIRNKLLDRQALVELGQRYYTPAMKELERRGIAINHPELDENE